MADARTRLADVHRGTAVRFTCDGEPIDAYKGETIAAALLAAERRTLRRTPRAASPRGLFCGMGVCFDCVMIVDGEPGVRSCMTTVRDGMVVATRRP